MLLKIADYEILNLTKCHHYDYISISADSLARDKYLQTDLCLAFDLNCTGVDALIHDLAIS